MTEHELRLLVREAIARQGVGSDFQSAPAPRLSLDPLSHKQFDLPAPGTECIIEPSVPCTHCGYCKSYGH
jgi:hypothetical protein